MTLQPLSQLASRSPNVALAADTYSAGMKLAALPLLQTLLGDKGGGTVLQMVEGFPYGVAVQHGDVELGLFALEMHFVTGASGIKVVYPKDPWQPFLTGINLHDIAVTDVEKGSAFQINNVQSLRLADCSAANVRPAALSLSYEYHGIYLNDCHDALITGFEARQTCGAGIKFGASTGRVEDSLLVSDPALALPTDLGFAVYGYPKGSRGDGNVLMVLHNVTISGYRRAGVLLREGCSLIATGCTFKDMPFAAYRQPRFNGTINANDGGEAGFIAHNKFINCKPLGGKAA